MLSWFAFWSASHPLGITTAFENTAAMVEKGVAPGAAETNELFTKKAQEGKPPRVDWEWMLVLGVFIGAWLSSRFSGDRTRERVPGLWAWRFGPSVGMRYIGALFGGVLMMFGARMAGGCTSGHGISGALQLALSSWIFVGIIFLTATLFAFVMFGKEGREHV